jgi:hypothetical protein
VKLPANLRVVSLRAVAGALLLTIACAHVDTKVQPIVISSHVLDVAGMTFETVAAGMVAASNRNTLTAEQVAAWNDFTVRWAVGYGAAVTQWVSAKQRLDQPAADQAVALLTGLLAELATFQFVAQGAAP